ncbi:DUF2339 domain-containing protein [Flagellimonas onchidii]|uniref:DUF2339 domain-containing protein n=1 Tax=Flagellimonas onchidii TaxID=2562684 RepID=UPI0010A5E67B|nr:DUF2339 domain-containing protein [Allomuricauda onchidii]
MVNKEDRFHQLYNRLEKLLERQNLLSKDISSIQIEIKNLKNPDKLEKVEKKNSPALDEQSRVQEDIQNTIPLTHSKYPRIKSDFEKFVGENLINKIGIIITIIGIAIGTKYSIDHDLIAPVTRIILGYSMGVLLLVIGMKLKKKYINYSAVLVSGAIAIIYFITYVAFSFYTLIPQAVSFIIMALLTVFAVLTALNYSKQVIAHFGLVGAYAVPFLLGDNSGNIAVLFSYMTIINVGILFISIKKYWKSLYYSSFILTWLIFLFWYIFSYNESQNFTIAIIFSMVFFLLFYASFLVYKIINKESFGVENIFLLLTNSFIFYGLVFSILNDKESTKSLLGIFTLGNGIMHSLVYLIISRTKAIDKYLTYLISGIAILFITIAVPVQLDGNWVTFLWSGEAALLFWIGRTKNVIIYEKLSYPLILLAFMSTVHDWFMGYSIYFMGASIEKFTPLININFLSSLFFVASIGLVSYFDKKYVPFGNSQTYFSKTFTLSISILFFFTIYYMSRLEIAHYWNALIANSNVQNSNGSSLTSLTTNTDLENFKIIWIINYSLLFISALTFINTWKLKDRRLSQPIMIVGALSIIIFLSQGLYVLSELRESYLSNQENSFNVLIRYISYVFFFTAIFACHRIKTFYLKEPKLEITFDLFTHIALVWTASSELINLLDISGLSDLYKLELSILWGGYSLLLIILGIWRRKKYLRIGAIMLFGITLLKLFFYDITHLSTVSKTIAFVSLGVLLLIISFLYNKYKHLISD